jgi:hypothetical protein
MVMKADKRLLNFAHALMEKDLQDLSSAHRRSLLEWPKFVRLTVF